MKLSFFSTSIWNTIVAAAILLLPALPVSAQTFPEGFQATVIASGIENPSAMTFAPDGRLFVCEQTGRLRVIKNDILLSQPFLQVTVSSTGERGLLGIAFDPDFDSTQHVYIYYTATTPTIHNRISRFTANGDTALAGSEVIIFELNTLGGASNHNGGAIHFGPDGKLYIATGDNANGNNAQSLNNLFGKILRINRDGTIPSDNPFDTTAVGSNRAIWALGLRNPFTFSFQPDSARMFINDVGESDWEEINVGSAGANYGWPLTEGYTNNPEFKSPLYAYQHDSGACAITGGAFYNPAVPQFPASYVGGYFFMDFCTGWLRVLHPPDSSTRSFGTGTSLPVDIKISSTGSLYYLQRGGGGRVVRVDFTGNFAPSVAIHPANVLVSVDTPATFSVLATGTEPMSYRWQRDSLDIPGATQMSYTLSSPQLSDSGSLFRCIVTNAFGSDSSDHAMLRVTLNLPPVATITLPLEGTSYSAGDTIHFAGEGVDNEEGNLPPAVFTWQVDFHHDDHSHPFLAPTSGIDSGTVVLPRIGETSANVWYRFSLVVYDQGGFYDTTYRDIHPLTSVMTFETHPAGLQIRLDGQPMVTPFEVTGVVGMIRSLEAVSPQELSGQLWGFDSWSHREPAVHALVTPGENTVYVAFYEAAVPVQLASFTGVVAQNGDVELTWVTVSEVNNYGFYVQRKRLSGTAFYEIPGSFTPGHGTTNEPHTYTYTDVQPGSGTWMYRLKQVDFDASEHFSEPIIIDVILGVNGTPIPTDYTLRQNYPNPFNPVTTIEFGLPHAGETTLKVFNLLGQEVATLADGVLDAGMYRVQWNASGVSSGVYFCRMQSGSFTQTRKLVVSK